MKRGGVRTNRRYDTGVNGKRMIKYEIQGRKNGVWIPVVETDHKTKVQKPMIYDTLKEAENKLKEIVKSIKGK
jgi:hypothetical protein